MIMENQEMNHESNHELTASRELLELALAIGCDKGRPPPDPLPCVILAQAYTMPLTTPIMMAETLPKVIGAEKNMSPQMASGSLFNAPTMLGAFL